MDKAVKQLVTVLLRCVHHEQWNEKKSKPHHAVMCRLWAEEQKELTTLSYDVLVCLQQHDLEWR